jgi:hemoglobin-like flavoprotein
MRFKMIRPPHPTPEAPVTEQAHADTQPDTPATAEPTTRRCPVCGSLRQPTPRWLVNASVDDIAAAGADEFVRAFYDTLFHAVPAARQLFPDDMTSQREKLLNAVIALARLFDPADEAKMGRLDNALDQFGRTHTTARLAGLAGLDAYADVGGALMAALRDHLGGTWSERLEAAWERRYRYAAGRMAAAAALADETADTEA